MPQKRVQSEEKSGCRECEKKTKVLPPCISAKVHAAGKKIKLQRITEQQMYKGHSDYT